MDKQEEDKKHKLLRKHELLILISVFIAGIIIGKMVLAGPQNRGTAQCSDGLDNDGDNQVDYPNDPGCSSRKDNSELNANVQCDDGIDNDGDKARDYPADPGCASLIDTSERGTIQCDDGLDNDGDGKIDYPIDPGCSGPADTDETDPAPMINICSDSKDNDWDGKVDYPNDAGCTSLSDSDESDTYKNPVCGNGFCESGEITSCTADCPSGVLRCYDSDDRGSNYYNSPNGANYFAKGTVTSNVCYIPGTKTVTTCSYGSTTDYCVSDGVIELYCAQNGIAANVGFPCSSCIDGTCRDQISVPPCPLADASNLAPWVGCRVNDYNIAYDVNTEKRTDYTCNSAIFSCWACKNGYVRDLAIDKCVPNANVQCDDGLDNDGDGKIDYPIDPGCTGPSDNDEQDPVLSLCGNGICNEPYEYYGNCLSDCASLCGDKICGSNEDLNSCFSDCQYIRFGEGLETTIKSVRLPGDSAYTKITKYRQVDANGRGTDNEAIAIHKLREYGEIWDPNNPFNANVTSDDPWVLRLVTLQYDSNYQKYKAGNPYHYFIINFDYTNLSTKNCVQTDGYFDGKKVRVRSKNYLNDIDNTCPACVNGICD